MGDMKQNYADDPQILDTTAKNFVARAKGRPRFLRPSLD